MPRLPMIPPTRRSNDPRPDKIGTTEAILEGGSMVLGLVEQASELSSIPYLSVVAGLALTLLEVAKAVRENKEGFQSLANEAADIVAVFYRAYQGAENQEEWLNSDGIRSAAENLEQCLESILKLGEKMKARGLVRRTLCYTLDVSTIKKYREQLASALGLFDVASKLDGRDLLVQIKKNTEELLTRSSGTETAPETTASRVVESELRARRRIQIENVEASALSFGAGNAVVQNGRAPGASESGRSTSPQRQNLKSKEPGRAACPSVDRTSGAPSSPELISVSRVDGSAIAFGDGDASVSNW